MSVVTPGGMQTIRETIEIVAKRDSPNVEHIVADGDSTDGTVDVLKSYPRLISVSENDEAHYLLKRRAACNKTLPLAA
jgi:glycosyltransferase involved in cell wall biosynthesis